MKLVKKRKITALLTLSIMLVAIIVVAAGVLTHVPTSYQNEDIEPTTTAIAINKASYTLQNASIAYLSFFNGSDKADLKVLFPNTIYIDNSENLSDTGYYFAYDVWVQSNNNYNNRAILFDNLFGYFHTSDSSVTVPTGNSATMHNVFDNYCAASRMLGTTDLGMGGVDGLTDNGVTSRNSLTYVEGRGSNQTVTIPLKGTVNNSYKSDGSTAKTATFEHGNGKYQMAVAQWYDNRALVGSNSWKSMGKQAYFGDWQNSGVAGTGIFHGISPFNDENNTNAINPLYYNQSGNSNTPNDIKVNIYVYDKSALNTAISNFESLITNNRTLLNKVGNNSTQLYNEANTYLNSAKTCLATREVTQEQINSYTQGLNNYVFKFGSLSTRTLSKTYDGNAVAYDSHWTRLDTSVYDVRLNNDTSVTEIKNVGTYTVEVRPKESTVINGKTMKFAWSDNSGNEYRSIGSFTVNPATFQVSGLNSVSREFNNQSHSITLGSATSSGTLNDSNFSGFILPSVNTKTVKLYLSEDSSLNASSIDYTGATDSVSASAIGTYTVYFKVSAPNHNDASGSFALEITKATVSFNVSSHSVVYGDATLDSEGIVDNMLRYTSPVLDSADWTSLRAYLTEIFTFRVVAASSDYTEGTSYLNAGSYSIAYTLNSEWSDRIGDVSFFNRTNVNAYTVSAKQVQVTWTQKTNMWYDGVGNKRPTAALSSGLMEGTNTALSDVEIDGQGEDSQGNAVALVNHMAVNVGRYKAKVECLNPNYIVAEASKTCYFDILPRPITVTVKNRTRVYGQDRTANEVWKDFVDNTFPTNQNQSVFTAVLDAVCTDGKAALIDSAPEVFELIMDIDEDDYTSSDSAERYFKVNTPGYVVTPVAINDNYSITAVAGNFAITPATIDLSLQQIGTKYYNGAAQSLTMPNNNSVIRLKGYEATHRDGVTIEYSDSQNGTYSATPLTRKNAGVTEVYYRVSAPNHNVSTGHFTAQITSVTLNIDVNSKYIATYGDEVPTSDQLKERLSINSTFSGNVSAFDFSNDLEYALMLGESEGNFVTSRRTNVGSYTLTHRFLNDDARGNYTIVYTTDENGLRKNLRVYSITPKTLYIDWAQSGAGWSNGMKYTYDGTIPTVYPVAPDTYEGRENVVVVSDSDRDNVTLADIELDNEIKGTYDVTAELNTDRNQNNYTIANPNATFEIVVREVGIYVYNQTAQYGRAKTVAFHTSLHDCTVQGAHWSYAAGSLHFIGEDYTNFTLVTEAHTPSTGETYKDVGIYDIELQTINSAGASNYSVSIVTDGAPANMQAKFEITPANLRFVERQFNIDFDAEDENNFVTMEQIRLRISNSYGTDSSEYAIRMSDLIEQTNDVAFDNVDNWLAEGVNQTTDTGKNDPSKAKRYYIWVSVSHRNYNTLNVKVEVNILSGWISMQISSAAEGQYGDPTMSSIDLFDALTFSAIYGTEKGLDESIAELRNYVVGNKIKFYVGAGGSASEMTQNESYGSYSIYVQTLNVVEGTDYCNFRFLDEDGKTGTLKPTTNIGAYVVGQRLVGIDWGDANAMDEIYGEHSATSPSHTAYSVTNTLPGDSVVVTLQYAKLTGGEWVDIPSGVHAKDVGTYRARVTAVSHPDYKLPAEWVETTFVISPRTVTIDVGDRTLTYGESVNATRSGVNAFLNRSVTGVTRYSVATGSLGFVAGDTVANIFRLKIGEYTLAANLDYLSSGSYDIEAEGRDGNYNILFNKGTLTVNNSTDVTYDSQVIDGKTYNGLDQRVATNNIWQFITLSGDGNKLFADTTVEYKLASDDDSKYSADYTLKLANTYSVNIRITAPNHEPEVLTASFTMAKANVTIRMTQAEKIFGETADDLIAKDGTVTTFSDWLKKYCHITFITTDDAGNSITVAGIEDDFQFKVIQKGQGNGAELEVGDYNNGVGTYRVYHRNDEALRADKYEIDYYQETGADAECNVEAYKINKATLEVRWVTEGAIDGNKFEYSGTAVVSPSIKAMVKFLRHDYESSIPYMSISRGSDSGKERVSVTNVGLYTAKVYFDDFMDTYAEELNNLEFSNDTFDFEIVAKKVTVTIKNQSFVYGTANTVVGAWDNDTAYTSNVEFYSGQPIDLSIKESVGKTYYDVATYNIQGKCTSLNYDVTFVGEDGGSYGKFAVTPAQMRITETSHSVTYNGSAYTVDVKAIIGGESAYTLAGDMTWNDAAVLYKQQDGTYASQKPVIDNVTGNSGQEIEYKVQLANHSDYTGTMTVVVNPARLVINVSAGAKSVYGDSLLSSDEIFEKSGAVFDPTASSVSSLSVDINQIFTLRVSGAAERLNVGTYNLSYTLKSEYAGMFNITLAGSTDAYEVTARQLTLQWNYTDSLVYNGDEQEVTATLVGVISGDSVAIGNYTGNVYTNAGTYTATARDLTSTNYTLGNAASLTWTISPKSIEVEWTEENLTYNGEAQTLTAPAVKSGQLIGGDTCVVTVNATSKTDAGTHTATASADNTNYTVSNATNNFVIKPAPVSIVWSDAALIYSGTAQAPSATVSTTLFGSDTCNVVVSGAKVDAGTDYVATATLDNSNYTVSAQATTTFAIAPKQITFTWGDTQLTYTGEQQTPNAVAVGAVTGDEVEFEIGIVEGSEAGVHVGNYTAIVTGVKANANYTINTTQQTSMSTQYRIGKGVNTFAEGITLPESVDKLPWSGSDKPSSKWGEVTVKYYTDEACTQEVTDITNAAEGKYWVKATVAGTSDYDEISQVFEVVLEGGLNIAIVIAGAVASVVLLIGALAVVISTNKKKNKGGAV